MKPEAPVTKTFMEVEMALVGDGTRTLRAGNTRVRSARESTRGTRARPRRGSFHADHHSAPVSLRRLQPNEVHARARFAAAVAAPVPVQSLDSSLAPLVAGQRAHVTTQHVVHAAVDPARPRERE